MDKAICCSCCGLQNSLFGKDFQEIVLHCSQCGRAVKNWSCHRHSCEVLIWAKTRRNYLCTKCTKSELKGAGDTNDISMLALSLSLELYYKCRRPFISDDEGGMLIDLWRKARISGTEFARAAAKEAAAAAYRASETDFAGAASERVEIAARSMMAELARNQARARARASVPAISPEASSNSGLTHRPLSRVQTPLITSDQKKIVFASTSNSSLQQPNLEFTGLRMKSCDQRASISSNKSGRRQAINRRKPFRPLLCGCRCQ